jgi:hypothetical protein
VAHSWADGHVGGVDLLRVRARQVAESDREPGLHQGLIERGEATALIAVFGGSGRAHDDAWNLARVAAIAAPGRRALAVVAAEQEGEPGQASSEARVSSI